MKRFKDLREELLNEGGEMYPADDMTMKEIKIACYAAQNILDRLESGQMIQRWQISAIVKAKEELASVYTSLSADEDDDEMNWDDMDEEDPMYVGFEYPSMYEEVDVNKTELKAAIDAGKKKGKIASVEAVKYIRAKHGLTHTRAHDVWKNIRHELGEETELDEGILKSYHAIANKPWSETVKASANTVGEYKQIAKGKDFTVWTGYRGSLKQQPHYVVKDDKIVGSGMTMNAALKDAKLKDSDLTARSKFPTGSILNKGMKEATDYEVDVEGLPKMFVKANSPTEVKNNLRKVVKNPDMIRGVERVAKATLQKIFRDKASGKDDVALDEEKHPIVKEYEDLKKHDINTLRGIVKQQSRISDTSEIRTKDHAITKILRHKHGNKKVAQAFGLDEEVDLDDISKKESTSYRKDR